MASDGRSDINPYQSPAAPNAIVPSAANAGDTSDPIIELLAQTRPWVLFLGIVGLLVCGLIIALSLFRSVFSALGAGPGKGGQFFGGFLFEVLFWGSGCVASSYLVRFSQRIRDFRYSHNVADLEAALAAQKLYWRVSGILTALLLCFFLLAVFAFMIIG
ncbi:MAG TPA: hypothetical protein VHC22_18480 [Pirellulales bacterium]|nr:hypothetical protein [Pirellulales bacterium]